MSRVLSHAVNAEVRHEAEAEPWLMYEKQGYESQPLLANPIPGLWMNGQKEVIGDSSCFWSPIVQHLLKFYPDAKFIHLYRRPELVVPSWMGTHLLNDDVQDKCKEKIPCADCRGWRWRPFPDSMTDQFSRVCTYWVRMNEFLYQALIKADSKLLGIHDLTSRIDEIWDWLGLRGGQDGALMDSKILLNSKPTWFPKYKDWTIEHKSLFEQIIGATQWKM